MNYPYINWHEAITGVESCMRKQRHNVIACGIQVIGFLSFMRVKGLSLHRLALLQHLLPLPFCNPLVEVILIYRRTMYYLSFDRLKYTAGHGRLEKPICIYELSWFYFLPDFIIVMNQKFSTL